MLKQTLEMAAKIKNGRDLNSVFKHLESEIKELVEELDKHALGAAPGSDGIKGEAVDAINCLIDLIYILDPDVTEEEITAINQKKLQKWHDLYSEKPRY